MSTDHEIRSLVQLRLLVGFLGEKSNWNWWGSNFVEPNSEAFLSPIFSRTMMLARYTGVCEAAMLVHDEYIGVGANYHLYRMPDSTERAAFKMLADSALQQKLSIVLGSTEAAQTKLSQLAATKAHKIEGPVALGSYTHGNLDFLLHESASHYSRAFQEGYKCFPYMREAK